MTILVIVVLFNFLFLDTVPALVYTLSLHDALPIFGRDRHVLRTRDLPVDDVADGLELDAFDLEQVLDVHGPLSAHRSEEHTSELQSLTNLVCRLLLEKKKSLLVQMLLLIV